jgi:DNA polymerase III sliding clamp (beta) subunit (PCNA family)
MVSEQNERGQLKPNEWATIYSGAVPDTFFVQLFGSIPSTAKLEVEIDGTIQAVLTPKNSDMHANGTKIRLHNIGPRLQGYNYYPV